MQPAHDDPLSVAARALRTAFRACPSVIFVTTRGGVVVEATLAAAAFLNVPLEVLNGKPLLHFVARGDTARFRSFVHAGAPGGISVELRPRHARPQVVELHIQPAPERLIWIARSVQPTTAVESEPASAPTPVLPPERPR